MTACPICDGTPEGTILGPSFVQGFCKTCNGTGFVEATEATRTPQGADEMTMTLDRQGFELWVRRHFKYPNLEIDPRYPGFYADKVTAGAWEAWKESHAHLSQPQPVAQGEAVDEKLRKILTVGGYRTDGDSATLMERVHFMALENRDLALMQETLIKRHEESNATPTIPTGHKVVPFEPTGSMLSNGWERMPDSTTPIKGGMDFVYYIYKAMLAAAPDAGGV